ncbi:hypothetical protein ACHAXT_003893 [Thalassiosira profunda]
MEGEGSSASRATARRACHDDDETDVGEIAATPDMCHYCFDTLLKELLPEAALRTHQSAKRGRGKKKQSSTNLPGDEDDNRGSGDSLDDMRERLEREITYRPPEVDCPLFVTWSKLRSDRPPLLSRVTSSGLATPAYTTASSSNITDDESSMHDEAEYDLRGCIGTLAAKPLSTALSEFAITSALHDNRFDPIALSELPYLRVGVSLLVKYEECKHCLDWKVGVHGIIIHFEGRGAGKQHTYSATYLPEVASEQRWNQQEAVVSLVRKSGYRGAISDELLEGIRCTRYQSSKHRMSYQQYAMARHGGVDPLEKARSEMAVGEALRQRGKGPSKPCINL